MEYFNGYQTCEVKKASELASLNQEQSNMLASGPQDAFFEKLEIIPSFFFLIINHLK